MSVSPVSTTNYTDVVSNSTTTRTVKKQLGQADFLNLLATQFQHQDPMKPMEDTAFIANMAQFSSLEQSSAMSTSLTQLLANQNIATANSYIGRQVTLKDADGNQTTGTVSAVEITDGAPRLVIGDYTYALENVQLVEPAPAATTTDTTTTP